MTSAKLPHCDWWREGVQASHFLTHLLWNGKGVCKQMLETTLGEYYGVMSKDAVVKAPGQHPPSKGAATGYLAELQGKRVAVTDETSPGERVDVGVVLKMTGGGKVSSRLLFQNNVCNGTTAHRLLAARQTRGRASSVTIRYRLI
ncbi:hypothetical protein KFL_014360015 [Klebsormidium nitens]|uniref:Uncharacterized protein n=1 Tax=Klebsormidium nitens TaxID=105231 RepID=A0A1Y1IX39_KLENI|nr:hypothetical protein KFL_014360015 [Klebsormidium nitens]|eukprot:GAQ93317.1 hypothetical protein KFL_014360015 [Klebsormidium nitens]